MIHVVAGNPDDPALEVLAAGLRRSVTSGLVELCDKPAAAVTVFLSPRDDQAGSVDAAAARGKVLVFGHVGPAVATVCGLRAPHPLPPEWRTAANCEPAQAHESGESEACVHWSSHPLATRSPYRRRPFLRFDFADEWNNMGYGRITADGGPWSLSVAAEANDAVTLASAVADRPGSVPYVTLRESPTGALLWWNRPVGPVDSGEWAVVESFLADWRHEDLPCVPVLEEIPFGYDAALTMRLDCDEDVASARELFEVYQRRALPFSLAVMTGQQDRPENIALLQDVHAAGGAILCHSMTHPANWGGSEAACIAEARGSADWLEQRIVGLDVRYAVSPFHQNPRFVPSAFKQARLHGFVGGIIANDPEMLLARGGQPPFAVGGIVTHSQQCMLHGDCLLTGNDPLTIPKAAFRAAVESRSLFGYLDHPISSRYDYGWGGEARRLAIHEAFLDHIATEMLDRRVLWLSEVDALDWIVAKSRVAISREGDAYALSDLDGSTRQFAVRYRGKTVPGRERIDA